MCVNASINKPQHGIAQPSLLEIVTYVCQPLYGVFVTKTPGCISVKHCIASVIQLSNSIITLSSSLQSVGAYSHCLKRHVSFELIELIVQ